MNKVHQAAAKALLIASTLLCGAANANELTVKVVCGSGGLICEHLTFSLQQNGPSHTLETWGDTGQPQHSVVAAYVGDNLVLTADADYSGTRYPFMREYYQVYDSAQPIVYDRYYCETSYICKGNSLFSFSRGNYPVFANTPVVFAVKTAVPEPSTYGLVMLGAAFVVALRKSRSSA